MILHSHRSPPPPPVEEEDPEGEASSPTIVGVVVVDGVEGVEDAGAEELCLEEVFPLGLFKEG